MQPEKRRKMRCIYCNSLSTKKNGYREIVPINFHRKTVRKVKRYKCNECGKTFSKRDEKKQRYSYQVKIEMTRMHFEERMSYRVIAKRINEKFSINTTASQVCKFVNEIAELTKSSLGIKSDFSPIWEGNLTVDDKYISIHGKKCLTLVAIDSSGDVVHYELIWGEAGQDKYDDFFLFIKEVLKYPAKSITTDLDIMLAKSVSKVYGEKILYQKCIKHALAAVEVIIEYRPVTREYFKQKKALGDLVQQNKELIESYTEKKTTRDIVKSLFYSTNSKDSDLIMLNIKEGYGQKYPKLIEFINRHIKNLLTHQKDSTVQKTNNRAENLNKQIERRLKTIEGFQTANTAFNYLILYINYIRFRAYTDCRGNRRKCNGLSPLEVCSVKLKSNDWLKNSLILPKKATDK